MGFEGMVDRSLEPNGGDILGYDWKGNELYGGEHGFMIDGEFVVDDEAVEYLEEMHGLVLSGDVMKIRKYDI